ncbi:MAG: FAD-dependent oxidoreductase, partial [bacterium]|nr:FAD-dependent oxidoreductase [bacterium]
MVPEAYDVVIIGAGPSGIGAAAVLAEYSLKVLLIDEN